MESQPFSRLSIVYDAIFADVEYTDWCEFSLEVLQELGWLEAKTGYKLLDVACGTGNSALPYLERGFIVSGADASADMLEIAKQKLDNASLFQQSFLELNTGQQYKIITCLFDSLNNLLAPTDLENALQRIYLHLESEGVFVFDCNTPLGVTDLWDDNEFKGEVRLENGLAHYHWTHQALEPNLGEVTAQIWIMDTQGALQQEFSETHLERGYTHTQLETLLQAVGFAETHFYEYPDGADVTSQTPRFWGFAKKT